MALRAQFPSRVEEPPQHRFPAVRLLQGSRPQSLNLGLVKSEARRALDRGIPAPVPRSLYAAENQDPDYPERGVNFDQ
jgi:hypothetical protein